MAHGVQAAHRLAQNSWPQAMLSDAARIEYCRVLLACCCGPLACSATPLFAWHAFASWEQEQEQEQDLPLALSLQGYLHTFLVSVC